MEIEFEVKLYVDP